MIAPLTSGKCQLNGLVITLAVTLPILMSIVPHQASAKAAISFRLAPRAEAATLTSPRSGPPTEPLGAGCGGKRYRDPIPIGVAAPPILAIEARRIAANIAKLPGLLRK